MEEEEHGFINGASHAPPSLISLSNFSTSLNPTPPPPRLSSQFSEPTRPVNSARRLSWVSLQGRLVNAEEASSAKSIKGGLSGNDEAIAWDLFSPIHRILLVAIVAAVVNDSKKLKQISTLKRSVEIRDQVLSSMQQKLDNLCEQVSVMKDRPDIIDECSFADNADIQFSSLSPSKTKPSSCGCCTCKEHQILPNASRDSFCNTAGGDELSKFKVPNTYTSEQEERRMSDLSDWASSVTSAADIQLNALGIEQDIYNLQRECEEKDTTIKELSATVRSVNAAGSKRIAELEDVVRRKNMIITKLKKDMVVLEDKIVQLIRLRRPSCSSTVSVNTPKLPVMKDNLLYDMDSTTSPSSSDSDSDLKNQLHISEPSEDNKDSSASRSHIPNANGSASRSKISLNEKDSASRGQISSSDSNPASRSQIPMKASPMFPKTADRTLKQRRVSPLQENTMNQRRDSAMTVRPKPGLSTLGDTKGSRRRSQLGFKGTTESRRWS